MPATCFRCIAEGLTPGEPFGVCAKCSCLACETCGNRVPKRSVFFCLMCFGEEVLWPEGFGRRMRKPPYDGGGGGGEGMPDGPPGPEPEGIETEPVFSGSAEFELLLPEVAEATRVHRSFFTGGDGPYSGEGALDLVLRRTRDYAFDEVRRREIDESVAYVGYAGEEELTRRAEAFEGARLLARDIDTAEARGALRRDLLSDALGVLCWSIGVMPGHGTDPIQLARLADVRLRFAIGSAMPVVAGGAGA